MARRHATMKVDHCIESCPLNGGVRTNDNLQALWVVMLKAAGFQSVRLEDRSWDAEAPRLQSIAKLQSLGAEGMGTIKQLVKLGDMLQVEGLAQQALHQTDSDSRGVGGWELA